MARFTRPKEDVGSPVPWTGFQVRPLSVDLRIPIRSTLASHDLGSEGSTTRSRDWPESRALQDAPPSVDLQMPPPAPHPFPPRIPPPSDVVSSTTFDSFGLTLMSAMWQLSKVVPPTLVHCEPPFTDLNTPAP